MQPAVTEPMIAERTSQMAVIVRRPGPLSEAFIGPQYHEGFACASGWRVEYAALAVADDQLWGSTLTRTEVLAGMRDTETRATYRLLDLLGWVPVDDALADAAGELARTFLPAYRGIVTTDFVIAATAVGNRGRLLTQNIKHFAVIDGLRRAY